MQQLLAASPETIPLLRRFSSVVIDDCTSLGLPAALAQQFPGCGGSDPEAGQAGFETAGPLRGHHRPIPGDGTVCGRDSERILVSKRLPAQFRGSLHLADLGFFDYDELAKITQQGG